MKTTCRSVGQEEGVMQLCPFHKIVAVLLEQWTPWTKWRLQQGMPNYLGVLSKGSVFLFSRHHGVGASGGPAGATRRASTCRIRAMVLWTSKL